MQTDRKRVFLSNGFTSAIEDEGSIVWFPCPKFDSPSVFSKILDEKKGGYFSIRPDARYSLKTKYIEDTLVAENIFSTGRGKLVVKDFLPIGLPAIIRVFESKVPFIIDIEPAFNYGMVNPTIEYSENGISFRNEGSMEGLELSINGSYEIIGEGVFRVQPGKGYLFAMYSRDLRYGLFSNKSFVFPDPFDALEKAVNYWRAQLIPSKKIAKFKNAYNRSILVALGLIYAPSGAIIAAPTTSLPENIGDSRNWDYRYLWIRDASYAAEALTKIGYTSATKRILEFMMSVIDPSSKSFDHPLYSIDGTAPKPEENMGWLSGNRGSKPVRIGNAAYMQVQMDTEGAFLNALYTYLDKTNEKSYVMENWFEVESTIEWIAESWMYESASIWEERNTLRHYVHTKVMLWVAADRAAKMASIIGKAEEAKNWAKLAGEIKEDVMRKGFSAEANSFVQYYGSDQVDASLLTLPLYGFIDAKDPRFLSTLKRIEKELTAGDGLLFRYKSDFQGKAVHPFALPSTWLARIYLRTGDRRKAEHVIDRLIKCSTDLLLLAEHVDIKTKEPRGNFPQLFSHIGLIQAITELEDPTLYAPRT
jgi:GH15 family glucan-1,4-alpha-glucosidase